MVAPVDCSMEVEEGATFVFSGMGYVNPEQINPAEWQYREDEGILYVPKADEILYRVKDTEVTA